MLNKDGIRELCYLVIIDEIKPIPGKDRVECAMVGGWSVMVKKDQFKKGDIGIYFEIDSRVPEEEPFLFLKNKNFKIKTQKYKTTEGYFYSQGLLMHPEDFQWRIIHLLDEDLPIIKDNKGCFHHYDDKTRFLTSQLKVTHIADEDNIRKNILNKEDKYKKMARRHPNIFKNPLIRKLMKNKWGKNLLFFFFGRENKKENKKHFPTHFTYIKKTDQERCENMVWVLKDKTPFIVTEKCDGSSATYILERKPFGKFEFYVCSRNVRQLTPDQESYYDENYYWQCAIKYDIENKLRDYLLKHPELMYVCWQGEICGPGIQKNPHALSCVHLFCFHMIDSEKGKYDIREAEKIWKEYNMEVVPIKTENYILPDDFEEFKLSADGEYSPSCCEGHIHQKREGFVYYKTDDPNFSFKNVSRNYLSKRGE